MGLARICVSIVGQIPRLSCFSALGIAQVPEYAWLQRRPMTKALDLDLKRLNARAFDRAEWAEGVLRGYHATTPNLNSVVAQQLCAFYNWMLVPPTLWPFNVEDVLADCRTSLEKGKRLNSRHRLLIDLLPEPPNEAICAAVAGHELHVQKGTYENLVKTQPSTFRMKLPSGPIQNNGRASKPPSISNPTATTRV
jgi:hypothetical protein